MGASASVPKRRRRQEGPGGSVSGSEAANAVNNKKGRRPKQEERVSYLFAAINLTEVFIQKRGMFSKIMSEVENFSTVMEICGIY